MVYRVTCRRWPARVFLSILTLLILVAVAAGAAVTPSASAATVARGLCEPYLPRMEEVDQEALLRELKEDLRASYVRFMVSWRQAEPKEGEFDSTYMAGVASAVDLAESYDLKIIITFHDVPKWASQKNLWPTPDGYRGNFAMSLASLPAFESFCEYFSAQFRGRVFGYECWNEPNQALFIRPQSRPGDPSFAVKRYIKMLERFSKGITAGDPHPTNPKRAHALRIAGATGPNGNTGVTSSFPIRFAQAIKGAKGATSWFDAYSHHPYSPSASAKPWPEAPPRDPSRTVNLQNLKRLLNVFPKKPFYLTEYGYTTVSCNLFGQSFSQATQAEYLRRAYVYAKRFPQVKMLMWYLLTDQAAGRAGVYTGLREANGAKKPAWFTFAQGSRLTVTGPNRIRKGKPFTLEGKVTWRAQGVKVSLVLQDRVRDGKWIERKTVKAATVKPDGSYTVQLRAGESKYYRLVWPGVVTGKAHFVKVTR